MDKAIINALQKERQITRETESRVLGKFEERNGQIKNEFAFDIREHDQKDEEALNKIAKEIDDTKNEIFDMKKEGLSSVN